MIRALRTEDVRELNALLRVLIPESPAASDAGLLHWVANHPGEARFRNWVAVENGEIAAWAFARFETGIDRRDAGMAWAGVREDLRGRRIGSELATVAETHLLKHGARKLGTFAHEATFGQRFAEARGYVRTRTERFSMLDPRAADTTALAPLAAEKRGEGLHLAPLRRVRDRPRELHRVFVAVHADMPGDETSTGIRYEDWLRWDFENPDLDDDGSFVVLAGERIVSLCLLVVDRGAGLAENETTGTEREFRRRGLARLVKLASIRWAAENGIREIWTGNDAENPGMLALNRELGYELHVLRAELSREL